MELPAELIDKAMATGHVSLDDLLDALPREVETLQAWEQVVNALEEHGISLVGISDHVSGDRAATPGDGSTTESDASDILGFYLWRTGTLSLLTGEQEREQARRIEQGREAASRLASGGAFPPEIEGWLRQIAEGEEARDKLIRTNLRLVVSIAKRYRGLGLPFLDLIQEGNIGLMEAVDRFDWRRGTQLSTYATWWIRNTIMRALNSQSRTIKLPTNVTARMRDIRQAGERLRDLLGRRPTEGELSERAGVRPGRVRDLRRVTRRIVSLDAPISGDAHPRASLGDVIEDRRTPRPLEQVSNQLLSEDVHKTLANLSKREQHVLRLRYGLADGATHTLEELSNELGVTRERVRQIEKRALRKLRHPLRGRRLRTYVRA